MSSGEESNSHQGDPDPEINEDDSFEEKNRDLIDQEEDSEEAGDEDGEKIHAWGSQKDKFYQSDEQSDSELEEEEEKEAFEIQKKNAEMLEDHDFYDEDLGKMDEGLEPIKSSKTKEKINDIGNMTEEEKLNLIIEESPELLCLLKDYKKLMLEMKNKIGPLKEMLVSKEGPLISQKLRKYICMKNDLITSYCVYILYYLSLKNSPNFSKNHPVFNKLINAKSMLKKLNPFEKNFSQEISSLLEQAKKSKIEKLKKKITDSSSTMKESVSKKVSSKAKDQKKSKNPMEMEENLQKIYEEIDDPEEQKRLGLSFPNPSKVSKTALSLSEDEEIPEVSGILSEEDLAFDSSDFEDEHYKSVKQKQTNEKKRKIKKKKIEKEEFFKEIKLEKSNEDEGRKITYEMLKNKGLTRKRKKIDRNARVKHRVKYHKSLNKLKSKGIYLRKKDKAYQGELTGINAGLKKGVSLKASK